MKVTGFTFVRNAIQYDYPVVQSITSMMPLCDEVIVLVGNSLDNTRALIADIASPKIKIVDSTWDDTLRQGGRVLAQETDKAYAQIPADTDWCIYLQADEVLHEADYENITAAMQKYRDDAQVDGLLFRFYNFYGAYQYMADAYSWHQYECRVLRKRSDIFSYRDALGFRKANNQKLRVKEIDAAVYHYGWVRPPAIMQRKIEDFHKLWHSDSWIAEKVKPTTHFDYHQIDSLQVFEGTHPAVMRERIAAKDWSFSFDFSQQKMAMKYRLRKLLKQYVGWEIGGFRNWKRV